MGLRALPGRRGPVPCTAQGCVAEAGLTAKPGPWPRRSGGCRESAARERMPAGSRRLVHFPRRQHPTHVCIGAPAHPSPVSHLIEVLFSDCPGLKMKGSLFPRKASSFTWESESMSSFKAEKIRGPACARWARAHATQTLAEGLGSIRPEATADQRGRRPEVRKTAFGNCHPAASGFSGR